jgi:phosphopantothenoylcysteine decarboxylase/phosphopantothenate--cysteine ligase
MARILLGVSGGIAAYKALELVRLATAAGHSVRVVQTPTSKRFVGTASFAALTGAPVLSHEFEDDPARGAFPDQRPPEHAPLNHLQLVANADVFLVAPASANTLSKAAGAL